METLQGYEFSEYLGQGQTKTWRATRLGEAVVVKTLELERVADWKGIELFEREASTLKQLDHASIPRFVDFRKDEHDGAKRWHMVQSHVTGAHPTAAFAGASLTEANLRSFSVHVLQTLVYLQSFSPPLIHRDIKPDNLLVNDDGVSLVDFGSVRHVVPSRVGGSTVAGTSGYMAPEQLMGRADKTSDLYGLGMTLVRLMTKLEPDELPKHRMKIEWRAHTKVRLSEPFAKFVDTLCEPHPEARYKDASDALHRMDATAPPPILVPEVSSTLKLTEEPGGVLLARSWGLTSAWASSLSVILMTFVAVFLGPIVLVLSPFFVWWFAVNSTNTRFQFSEDALEVETGWVFKKTTSFPASVVIGLDDTSRKRGPAYLGETKVTGKLSFRERSVLRDALEMKAVSHIESVAEGISFDFEKNESTSEERVEQNREVGHER